MEAQIFLESCGIWRGVFPVHGEEGLRVWVLWNMILLLILILDTYLPSISLFAGGEYESDFFCNMLWNQLSELCKN